MLTTGKFSRFWYHDDAHALDHGHILRRGEDGKRKRRLVRARRRVSESIRNFRYRACNWSKFWPHRRRTNLRERWVEGRGVGVGRFRAGGRIRVISLIPLGRRHVVGLNPRRILLGFTSSFIVPNHSFVVVLHRPGDSQKETTETA